MTQAQGIIGELFFLKEKLIPKYGIENAIKAWIGPNGANKDFEVDNIWFEIKTKSLNKEFIQVSNEHQLKSDIIGYLVIINTEKCSEISEDAVSIDGLVNEIIKDIGDIRLIDKLEVKLAKSGYINKNNEYYFRIKDISFYKVNKKFPQIEMSSDINAIINVKYDLLVSKLDEFRVDDYFEY